MPLSLLYNVSEGFPVVCCIIYSVSYNDLKDVKGVLVLV